MEGFFLLLWTPSAHSCPSKTGNVAEACPDHTMADCLTAVFGWFPGRPQ